MPHRTLEPQYQGRSFLGIRAFSARRLIIAREWILMEYERLTAKSIKFIHEGSSKIINLLLKV